ncbi:cupin domain-containing protein [Lysobacter sp. KIS68-7]|uniref:cupin domain-containing protein n=1 Tax=Lysobacter sp. KIS68-7 TaxID=2904252 RepID=UPI001E45E8E0|nr:cupin domain-containing protein [Lysobacter sp. KIS68-7]UHQ19550.1 cupin domain-containing protein [Lysobacter sp. KIS68-7]
MRWTPRDWLERLPGPATDRWPEGERFVHAFARGAVSVELYAPVGHDPQTPHAEDELYFIVAGTGVLSIDGVAHPFAPGDMFFVPAHAPHRFERFSEGFAAWAVFWPATGAP